MKKFLSIAAICAMAMVTMVSCDGKKKTEPAPTTPKVNLTVDNASIAPESKATVTLTATSALSEAVEFTIATSDAGVATVSSEKVTIAKGEKSATVEVTGLKDGKSTITATTASKAVEMGVSSVEITVTSSGPGANIVEMTVEPADWGGFLFYFPDGSFSFNFYPNSYSITGAIQIDNFNAGAFGTLDSQGYLVVSAQTEGAAIKASDSIIPENDRPVLYSSTIGATALGTGEDVYVAFMAWDDADIMSEAYRVWAKIKIGTSGAFNSLEVIEVYACLSNGEFKVGQKQ